MTTGLLLRQAWDWEPSIVAGCVVLLAVYLLGVRPLQVRRVLAFVGGDVLMLLVLVGPLDYLGDEFLFSAHMLEHLLLLVAVPPLLLMGLPEAWTRRLLALRIVGAVERTLRRPVLAWLIAVVTLYAWHAPALYNAALADERIHALQHLSFLVTATIYWWPILSPLPECQLRGAMAIVYLFLAAVANSVLGALLTFSAPGLYPMYLRPTGDSAVLAFIRDHWALDPTADQQLGGLLMWVVGGFFFLWAVLAVYGRWYRESDRPEMT